MPNMCHNRVFKNLLVTCLKWGICATYTFSTQVQISRLLSTALFSVSPQWCVGESETLCQLILYFSSCRIKNPFFGYDFLLARPAGLPFYKNTSSPLMQLWYHRGRRIRSRLKLTPQGASITFIQTTRGGERSEAALKRLCRDVLWLLLREEPPQKKHVRLLYTRKEGHRKKGRANKKDEKGDQVGLLPHTGDTCTEDNMAAVLTELQNRQEEYTEASQDTKVTLTREESCLTDVLVHEIKQRVCDAED